MLVLACHKPAPSAPTSTFDGAVRGATLAPKAATLRVYRDGNTVKGAVITLSDNGALCQSEQTNTVHPNTTDVTFYLQRLDPNGQPAPASAGDYSVSAMPYLAGPNSATALVTFTRRKDQCLPDGNVNRPGIEGTVHLADVQLNAGGAANGTFDVHFGPDHATGAFHAVFCDDSSAPATQRCE